MAQYSKSIPKDPHDPDMTLETVLDAIIFQTADGDELVKYQNNAGSVVLVFDGED